MRNLSNERKMFKDPKCPTAVAMRNVRKKLNMTQNALALKLRLCKGSVISRYEKGYSKPCIEVCIRLVQLCKENGIDITIDSLRPN